MGGALDIVSTFGPTPLDELTARVSAEPAEVAEEINKLAKDQFIQVSDAQGNLITEVTPEQAASAPFLVQLSPRAIKRALK
jgi:hypothetical protein